MPEEITDHSDEVQEIIAAVPSWILRWGIVLIFSILVGIVGLSALIKYPDVVKVPLKVGAGQAPKAVLARQAGRIVLLLAREDEQVKQGQALAYLESTARHGDVIRLERALQELRQRLGRGESAALQLPENGLSLGELQADYQNFYQRYLQYRATLQSGYYQRKRQYLQSDLQGVLAQKHQIEKERKVQEQSFRNIEASYEAYKKLYAKKVVSLAEFRDQENKYLGGKSPLQQNETALLNNRASYAAKEKELFDLEHTINEEKAVFLQALNGLIADTGGWLTNYVAKAPIAGRLSYGGALQANQNVQAGQELFVVNSGSADFYGEVNIPQQNMGKIRQGQKTLVKLYGYPYEQFGMIRGRIGHIADAAYRDSVFMAKVKFEEFENRDPRFKIKLKNGMLAQAEIITEDSSLLQRFVRNIGGLLK